jgi:hypothetical protein
MNGRHPAGIAHAAFWSGCVGGRYPHDRAPCYRDGRNEPAQAAVLPLRAPLRLLGMRLLGVRLLRVRRVDARVFDADTISLALGVRGASGRR